MVASKCKYTSVGESYLATVLTEPEALRKPKPHDLLLALGQSLKPNNAQPGVSQPALAPLQIRLGY